MCANDEIMGQFNDCRVIAMWHLLAIALLVGIVWTGVTEACNWMSNRDTGIKIWYHNDATLNATLDVGEWKQGENPCPASLPKYNSGHCYGVYKTVGRVPQVEQGCQSITQGGSVAHLVSFDNQEEYQVVREYIKATYDSYGVCPDKRFYTGITDEVEEGRWVDQLGNTDKYVPWFKNWSEPNGGTRENCAALSFHSSIQGMSIDVECKGTYCAICKLVIPTSTPSTATTGTTESLAHSASSENAGHTTTNIQETSEISNAGVIAGIIIGLVLTIVAIVAGFFFFVQRQEPDDDESAKSTESGISEGSREDESPGSDDSDDED